MSDHPQNKAVIRAHLDGKSESELKNLLSNLLQRADEQMMGVFWAQVTDAQLNREKLYYGSPELYLAEVKQFAKDVDDLKYFDSEIQEQYDHYSYYDHHGGEYDDFDADSHQGIRLLKRFLKEADLYFQAREYRVVSRAYRSLQDVVFGDSYELLGVGDLLDVLGRSEKVFVQRYLVSLQQCHTKRVFYHRALGFLSGSNSFATRYLPYFFELVGDEQQTFYLYLEEWADQLDSLSSRAYLIPPPLRLRLLMNFYIEQKQPEKALAVQHHFRRIYLGLFVPLLAGCEAGQAWQKLIDYAQELLELLPANRTLSRHTRDVVNFDIVRTQMAKAYEALGQAEEAFAVYNLIFEQDKTFERYALATRFATGISPQKGEAFSNEIITELEKELPAGRFILCEIYLSRGEFDKALELVKPLNRYGMLEELKLVAKAHLILGLGKDITPKMGPYLQDLYRKVQVGNKEAVRFLRDHLPTEASCSRDVAIQRAENLYRRIMQMHISNGRKTYGVAAYYCALLGEIATHEGKEQEFREFYNDLLANYPRHRALRRELMDKVG